MTEILTESFCERCGTRYTFESAAPRKSRLARVRVLSKGVRNFVMSDDSSLSEAMAEARNEEELAATSYQLDAFHQTFNFCLTCRQYTCGDCWNDAEGRCLTCAPLPGQDEPVALIDLAPAAAGPGSSNGHHAGQPVDMESWPAADLPRIPLAADAAPAPDDGFVERRPDQPDVVPVMDAAPIDRADDAAEAGPRITGLAPGQSLDDAIAAYEALLEADAEAAAEEGAAVEALSTAAESPAGEAEPSTAMPEPAAEPPAATSAAAAPLDAEPEVAEPEAAAPVAASAEPVAPPAPPPPVDDIRQPTWPAAATHTAPASDAEPAPSAPPPGPPPAPPTAPPNPWLTVAPDEPAAPEWPAAPQWPGAPSWPTPAPRTDAPLTLAGRALLPQADTSALWAASAQEVLGAAPVPLRESAPSPTAQPCVSCGLSLSANARFCRRCGSRQG